MRKQSKRKVNSKYATDGLHVTKKKRRSKIYSTRMGVCGIIDCGGLGGNGLLSRCHTYADIFLPLPKELCPQRVWRNVANECSQNLQPGIQGHYLAI